MWTVWANDKQEEIFATCPQAQERTFPAHLLTPRIAECLKDQLVALTTLNILLPGFVHCYRDGYLRENHLSTRYTPQSWHQLLCECPNLRHLKTLKIPYMVEYMDLHRRNSMLPPIEDPHSQPHVQPVPGIWICRGLETLHLDPHIHDNTRKGIAYGYVARVCPHLQDLRISFPEFCNFGGGRKFEWQKPFLLEDGLCLLSRLGRLERLRVEYRKVECEIAELNRLCRSGRAAEHRTRRREIVDGWTSRLEEEAVMEAARLENSARATMDIIGVRADDKALMASLSNLGLLQDVKDMMAEIDADEFVCLPELQQVACGNHLEQRPEKEIRSLFYVAPPTLKEKWLIKSKG